jgi:hypothetical protein
LIQCSRIAFGFAGIMDKDEFDQWQQAGHMTAGPQTNIPDIDDIPQLSDNAVDVIVDQTVEDDDGPGTITPDKEALFLENLKHQLSLAKTPAERDDVADQNDSLLDHLSDEGRRLAEKIIEGREQ